MADIDKLFNRLNNIALEIEDILPPGYHATAVANGGGKILIYMSTAVGKSMFAELVPDDTGKHLKVVMKDSIEAALKTVAARIEL